MSISKPDKPALILIDIQKAFDNVDYWGRQQNKINAENNASELLTIWRANNLPIFVPLLVSVLLHWPITL